jgi:Fe-S cluster biogenesis protein NfuA
MLTKEQVEKEIDEKIRPGLMMDGGNINIVKVEDNTVYVELEGACHGCPGAAMTLQYGVERILREAFPELKGVVKV